MNAIPPRPIASLEGRAPPHSIEAEQALLGACLINGDAIDLASAMMTEGDFYDPAHGRIWSILQESREQGRVITAALLRASFGAESSTEIAPGKTLGAYISALMVEAASVIGARDYAATIRHLADCRRIIAAAREAGEAAYKGMLVKPSEVAAGAIQTLDAMVSAAAPAHAKAIDLAGAASDALDKCEAIADRRAKPFEVSWGLRSLNFKTNGLAGGDLVIIGGRPSMGKSTIGLAIALEQAKAGQGTYFVSLEMTAQQLGQRALAWRSFNRSHNPVSYKDLRGGHITADQREILRQAKDELKAYPLIVEQEGGLTIGQIAARARKHKAAMDRAGRPLRSMLVDQLNIIKPSDRYKGQRTQEVTEFTGALKTLAKELEIPIICMCQLSRATESRDDKRPTLADFRDSGSIEQDADIIIGVYRAAYYLERKTNLTPEEQDELMQCQNLMEAIFLKQRQGDTGAVQLYASMPCNYICDVQR